MTYSSPKFIFISTMQYNSVHIVYVKFYFTNGWELFCLEDKFIKFHNDIFTLETYG